MPRPVGGAGAQPGAGAAVGTRAVLTAAVGGVAAQAAVLTALLYYMGWVRSHATLGYFGIDPRMLGYSPEDYVLRSLNATFVPLVVCALIGLALLVVHQVAVEPRLARGGRWTVRVVRLGLVVGVVLAVVVCARLVAPEVVAQPSGLVLPAALTLSVALIAYCSHLRAGLRAEPDVRAEGPRKARAVVLIGLGLISVLWSLASYAHERGVARAEDIAARLRMDPAVTVYSEFPLAINGRGVGVAEFGEDGHKYRFVYTGLRLLQSGGGSLVLISPWWRKGDKVYVLDDDDSIRVDFTAIR